MPTRARRFAIGGVAAALISSLCPCGGEREAAQTEVRVRVDRVVIDESNTPVVVLEEEGGTRWLPIWIGSAEARSIALEMEALRSPRPNTHDLARDLIEQLDAKVARAVVTELREGTYYAILHLRRDGRSLQVDARPSDAIAIALRARAPIFVREPLFEQRAADERPGEGDAPRREI